MQLHLLFAKETLIIFDSPEFEYLILSKYPLKISLNKNVRN